MNGPGLAIHGGAGITTPGTLAPEHEQATRTALEEALVHAGEALGQGAPAVAVAEAAVRSLEDCELFNAGRGAVLNAGGDAELDAAIMDGAGRRCGAVAAVRQVRNPVQLARRVLEDTVHVLLVGPGADAFAARLGIEPVPNDYFVTGQRQEQLALAAAANHVALDHDGHLGTVGAVVRDRAGHLAAATSTGGMSNQLPGRVGDSPVIGAGTWADDTSCAVSATGHGEYFMRTVLAYQVHARLTHGGETLEQACRGALAEVGALGGRGGLIALGRQGPPLLLFDTPCMYRGWLDENGVPRVAIHGEEP